MKNLDAKDGTTAKDKVEQDSLGLNTPSYFTPEEHTPVHKTTLEYLQKRVADIHASVGLVSTYLAKTDDTTGAPEVLDIILESLWALHDNLVPGKLVAPITRDRVEIVVKRSDSGV